MPFSWGLAATIALLWPSRLVGPLDGIPLDSPAKAILFGLALPALWWFDPTYLRRRVCRVSIVALMAWKIIGSLILVQEGLCVSVVPTRPYVMDGNSAAAHSWDLRAGRHSAEPSCTAIMTRPYLRLTEFPVWFFNLPPAVGDELPANTDLPPNATTAMVVEGAMTIREPGVFRLITSAPITATVRVDERPAGPTNAIEVPRGVHTIRIDATLTGKRWQFIPLWNDGDVWQELSTTVSVPSRANQVMSRWGRWMTVALAGCLLAGWMLSAWRRIGDLPVAGWTVAASAFVGWFTSAIDGYHWHWMIVALFAAVAVPVPTRLRNARGMFVLIGIPWLVFLVVMTAPQIGRFTLYAPGNDYWLFQRFAYRIFFQGYWLEGGEKTFWFQPLHRWTAGMIHLILGHSSIGEAYADGMALLVMAMFAFRVTSTFAGFRWALVASVSTLVLFLTGPGWIFIGRGLSEISSAGFIYLSALISLRSRKGSIGLACLAGLCALLASFTRLNNIPMAAALVVFAWPASEPVTTLYHPSRWRAHVRTRTLLGIGGVLTSGFVLFALRTWYYTGVFSVFHGTALDPSRGYSRWAWQPGMTIVQGLRSLYESVMIVLTTSEPPKIHNGALPLIVSALLALLAVMNAPGLRRLPAGPVFMYLAALSSALVGRGTAYPGRFSIHILGAAATALICAVALSIQWILKVVPLQARSSLDRQRDEQIDSRHPPRSEARPATD